MSMITPAAMLQSFVHTIGWSHASDVRRAQMPPTDGSGLRWLLSAIDKMSLCLVSIIRLRLSVSG